MPKLKKRREKRKLKGLAGIVAAAASTENVKPVFANHPYFQYREEKDWEGVHTSMGTMGLGFYKRLEKDLKKIKKKNGQKNKPKPDWTCKCGRKGDLTVFEELQMTKGERKRCLCGKLARISQDAWERIHGR